MKPGSKHTVGTVGEIPPGTHKIVVVEGRSVGIYNIGGKFHALRNICPHQGAELCKGLVTPYVSSQGPGNYHFEREGEIVRCPWHQWEFDIATGCMITDAVMRTKTYDVTVEKFGVSIEQDHIVLHM